jgi:hypothetical protein
MGLGKSIQAIILVVFLLFTASAEGQTGRNYKYDLNGSMQKSIVTAGDQSIIINYSISELNVENIINEYGTFYRVSIPGHNNTVTIGRPELPVYSRLITLPEGSEYSYKISQVRFTRIHPSNKKIDGILFPAQEGETKAVQRRKPEFVMDKKIYAAQKIISSDTVTITPLGKARHTSLANLSISPARYNPRTNSLEVITSMKIEITFSASTTIGSKSLIPGSAAFNQTLDKGTLNYNPEDVVPGYSDKPVKMIILTDTAFKKQLKPFIEWKTQKGFDLRVLYKGSGLAGNNYTEIKDTLSKIYNALSQNDTPPEYLLIIGDVTRIPYYGTGNITDMYYGEFDGDGDYMPEMYIGRLPVADTTELKSVLSKIIQYEKFEFADSNSFYSQALVTSGNDAGYANTMNGQVRYAISNYINSSGKLNESHFFYPESTNSTVEDSIKQLINKGLGFINFTGHGEAEGWLDPTIKSEHVPLLRNLNMYPFIISNACRTAQFNSAASFGNKMVLSEGKGAIGFIGCSNDSYWDEDFYWAVGPGTPAAGVTYEDTGLGAYDRLFHTHGEPASEWYITMGQINYAGNLAVSASTTSRKKYYWETYNVIGDPSVIPILGKPDTFNISLPDTLPNGLKSLSLNLEPFAYLAVSHFDTLWDASFASASGTAVLDMPGLSNDSCLVVITGQNRKPLIKKIYFSEVNSEFLNLTGSVINDSDGNNNKKADFGESFFLQLNLTNLGLSDADSLYAKVSSESDWVTIFTDSVFIGKLPGNTELLLPDKFGMKISANVPDMGVVTIKLMLKDKKTEKHYTIDICIHAPDLLILNCIMDDTKSGNGDLIADPGETFNLVFKVSNQGSSDISGILKVISLNPDITILESSVKSGLLKFGEITEIPIMVKLSETTTSGSYISVSSLLDCTPYLLDKDFSFRVGKIRESFESESFSVFPWINLSAIPWTITGTSSFDGSIAARSGAISHNGTSSLIIKPVYERADSVKFYYKISSEINYDTLIFRLNGTRIFKVSGEIPWTKIAVPVSAGLNIMEWIYHKDNSVSNGSDCAWIDMIDFAGSSPVQYIQKDIQVARIVSPWQKDHFDKETVTVKVLNTGQNTINGFNLAYDINDHSVTVQETFENTLIPSGDSVTVSFRTKADLSKYGIYEITAFAYDNNDDYNLNDTVSVSLENTEIDESLSVYPNPFSDKFTVFLNSRYDDRARISITNMKGVCLYSAEQDVIAGKNTIIVTDIKLLPSVYYLNIKGATFNKTVPVVKLNR